MVSVDDDVDDAEVVEMLLPPRPSSVAEGRRFVTAVLTRGDRRDLLESAELLVSEVVTNALIHAGTPIAVTVSLRVVGLRVEVSDGSQAWPVPRRSTVLAGTGRGVGLLEQLSDRWGVKTLDAGKTVWFEVNSRRSIMQAKAAVGTSAQPAVPAAARLDSAVLGNQRYGIDIVLSNVPLLLHAAWQSHAQTLLREHLLVGLGRQADQQVIDDHAAATRALTLLREQIPGLDLDDDPESLMATVTEPSASAERCVLSVTTASTVDFQILGAMLDDALESADAGVFLTPPTQPELRDFRRWVCDQVAVQAAGHRPTPWSPPPDLGPPQSRGSAVWDLSAITDSAEALMAADDTSRILAVSAPALELLGYSDAEELEGSRIVSIIPFRFRQAHLAGFTLHLAHGRGRLLGRPVLVPALRRDGTERVVKLTITVEHLPQGHRLFVAALRPAPAT